MQEFFLNHCIAKMVVGWYLFPFILQACSSVGRAPPRQGGGRWFEPSRAYVSCQVSVIGVSVRGLV